MGHHRDAGLHQHPDLLVRALAALQLHRAHAGLLDQPGRGAQGLDGPLLVGPEGQVGDDHGAAGAADDGRGEEGHLVEGDRHRGVVPEVAVAHRVADEEDGDARLVEDGRGHRVVGGEHGPLLAAVLGAGDVVDGDPAGGGPAVERLGVGGGLRGGSRKLRHRNGSFCHLEAP